MAEEDDRRRETRAPIELKVEYKRLNTFFYDYTKNISKGGTFIKTEKPLDVGTIFLFKLMLPSQSAPLALRGEVRWVVKDGAPLPPQVPAGHEPGPADLLAAREEAEGVIASGAGRLRRPEPIAGGSEPVQGSEVTR
jgi:uncharacterized protein (TIGR02266 family)